MTAKEQIDAKLAIIIIILIKSYSNQHLDRDKKYFWAYIAGCY